MEKSHTKARPQLEMKVLAMGLPRTGSASLAEALEILGYDGVYHGVKAIDSPEDWKIFDRAADATFPVLPGYTGKGFTQEQWNELYAPYEATTDMASVFGTHLIKAYPDAKVVLTIRDFDKWFKSMDENVLQQLWSPAANFSINVIEPILGSRAGPASRKMMLGLFQAKNVDEARSKAREAYDRHHREIQECVPANQLLLYRMGEGWGPLCDFLGRPVPDVEFPRVNEAAALKAKIAEKVKRDMSSAALTLAPYVFGVGALGIAYLAARQYSG
ncbi:hypothetical protein V2G26_013343 [Clonostachys chloroleuca]